MAELAASHVRHELSADQHTPDELGRAMATGLFWSLANNLVARLGNFLAGIVVVRLLAPEEYGTFAVGMVVLAVLLSMNELGVSVAIVQHPGRVDVIAPTVMTIAIGSSLVLAGAGYAIAPAVAGIMQAPEASGLIRLLLLAVVLDGVASVPNQALSRLFQQRKRLFIDLASFLVSTPLTIFLAFNGYGAWSLGWGAVVGNSITCALAMALSPIRVRPGWNRAVLPRLLRFGLPLAGASLLSLMLINADYLVVGHLLGPAALGVYLLAFNLCSWPITVVTSAVRRVATPLFARLHEHKTDRGASGFTSAFIVVLALVLPLCVLLAGFAPQVIEVLYGTIWLPAAAPLAPLVVLSFARVCVELTYDFLAGTGKTRSTVWLHLTWLCALLPAVWLGATKGGVQGVGAAHAIVACVVVGPTLAWLLRASGISLSAVLRGLLRPALGAGLMTVGIVACRGLFGGDLLPLIVGVPAALAAYAVCVWPLRREAQSLWLLRGGEARPGAGGGAG
jgi:PST family polysaccharide transporter